MQAFSTFIENRFIDFIVLGEVPGTDVQLGFRAVLNIFLILILIACLFSLFHKKLEKIKFSARAREFFGHISL